MIAPTIEALAKGHPQVTFAKVNTEEPENAALAMQFGIRGIPTIVFLEDGKEVGRFSGAYPKPMFEQEIQKRWS
jgi:thioredoxin 1